MKTGRILIGVQMVGLRYRKDRDVWEVDCRRHGVRSREHFHSKTTAQEYRRKMEDLIERERAGLHFIEPIKFNEFCKLFIENHLKELSTKYGKTVIGKINNSFIPSFKDKEMNEITLEDILIWKDKRALSGISSKTLRDDIFLLQLIFKSAIKNGYAAKNPVNDVDVPHNVPKKKRQAVHDNVLRQGLRHLTGIDLCIVLALRNSGMRESELFRLDADDLDFETKTIRVKSVEGGTTKNYQSRTTIMTPTFEKIVRQLGVIEGLVFRIPYKTFQNRFCRNKAERKINWDVHSLRHSFITKLRSANIPERVVAHYVGHAQKTMTDHYTSLLPEFVSLSIKAADFGGEFLKGSQNVVTLWSPSFENPFKNHALEVAGAGFEPSPSNKINNLAVSGKNQQNHRVWKKS